MGGDRGLEVVIPASVRAVKSNPDLRLLMVGDQEQIVKHLKKQGITASHSLYKQFSIEHASEIVTMD